MAIKGKDSAISDLLDYDNGAGGPSAPPPAKDEGESAAEFKKVGSRFIRLTLTRIWDRKKDLMAVLMANPSNAGGEKNDPTSSTLIRFGKALDFGGYIAVNDEPLISSSPDELRDMVNVCSHEEPEVYAEITRLNHAAIGATSRACKVHFVAWGNLVVPSPHAADTLQQFSLYWNRTLHAFDLTDKGVPKHPLARGAHRITEPGAIAWNSDSFLKECRE